MLDCLKYMSDLEKEFWAEYDAIKKADSEMNEKLKKVERPRFTEEDWERIEKLEKKLDKKAAFHKKLKDSPLIVVVVIILFLFVAFQITS